MSKRTYEEYIKYDCHPVGYNEACQRLIFSQISIDLLLDRIDQLNLQLKDYEDSDSSTMKYLNRQRDENIKLKQQLAEKDKEIESLKLKNQNLEDYYCEKVFILDEDYNKDLEERLIEIKELEKRQTQLAIQQLERVKVELKDKIKIMNNEEHCYSQKFVKWIDVCDQINIQIKKLKGRSYEN